MSHQATKRRRGIANAQYQVKEASLEKAPDVIIPALRRDGESKTTETENVSVGSGSEDF